MVDAFSLTRFYNMEKTSFEINKFTLTAVNTEIEFEVRYPRKIRLFKSSIYSGRENMPIFSNINNNYKTHSACSHCQLLV